MPMPRISKPAPNPNITPDTDDPNFYCKSCNIHYKNRGLYRQHLKRIHKIKLAPLIKTAVFNPTNSLDDIKKPNNISCAICKYTYNNRRNYRKHMKKYHSDGKNIPVTNRPEKTTINPNIQPDPEDPNHFRRSCQRTYSNRNNYHCHVRSVHINVKCTTRRKSLNPLRIEMDAGDPNNKRCRICEMDFKKRRAYLYHMGSAHKDGNRKPIVAPSIDTSVMPIWDDPNSYCRSCSKSFYSKSNYRAHINRIHGDILQQAIQPSASTNSINPINAIIKQEEDAKHGVFELQVSSNEI